MKLRKKIVFSVLMTLLIANSGCGNKKKTPSASGEKKPSRATVDRISSADFQKATEDRNKAIGALENKKWEPAIQLFESVNTLLPDSPTTLKNQAIATVLSIIDASTHFKKTGTSQEVEDYRSAVRRATAAIAKFRNVTSTDFDRALADHLEGLLVIAEDSAATGGFDHGLALLKKAADAMPKRPDFRFAVALAMDGNRKYSMGDSDRVAELTQQFQWSFQLAPENLFALQRLLKQQALSLNTRDQKSQEKRSGEISDTLKSAKRLLQPLSQSLKRQHNLDLDQTVDATMKAPNALAKLGPSMRLANLILPELATKIDQRRINKNLLEYLALDFDESYIAARGPKETRPPQEPTVIQNWKIAQVRLPVKNATDVQMRDFNLDGIDDLIVAVDGRLEVYTRESSDSLDWTLMVQSPAEVSTKIHRFLTADLDRDSDRKIGSVTAPVILQDIDGDRRIPTDVTKKNRWYDTDLDIIGYGPDGLCLLQNEMNADGVRQLTEWEFDFKADSIHDAVVADIDADGDLDLVLGTDSGMSLFRSINGPVFEAVEGTVAGPEFPVHSIQTIDWDHNVAIDFIASSQDGRSGLLENMLHGRFRWIDQTAQNELDSSPFVLQPKRNGLWSVEGDSACEFLETADLDNDGQDDLLKINRGVLSWHRFVAGDGFSDKPSLPRFPMDQSVEHVEVADYDADGDLDVIAVAAETGILSFIENQGGNTNNWIDVTLRSVFDDDQNDSSRVNMHGIGALVELWSGEARQRRIITQPRSHLGLGKKSAADIIRIVWTDGIPQNVIAEDALKGRIAIQAPQILKGSCPYIYTWTGEKFEFFSDCLWAAPIGLVTANGTVAPTREWENLLVPGDALVEKEGHYVLQLTEELWEIAYFDQVQLFCVDHPADTQVFTNEKVGPPSIAQHQLHLAKKPRTPVSITNQSGRNLLPGLKDLDQNYVQPFDGRKLQGLADEWTMEFDLGPLASNKANEKGPSLDATTAPSSIKLFLTGWIFPTDTSLNLSIHQNPLLEAPMPPVIEVPDENGTWRIARPFIGFPSGKTKAMVVDITDIFPKGTVDFRFRLRSTMELYFDHAFFTVNEREYASSVHACELSNADLHYRGFSRRTYADEALFRHGHAPEGYDYGAVSTEAKWPTIYGRFTKYGTATDLLLQHDDQMIVMGPGDEVTVSFRVPSTRVPNGWKRDFVLRNVGFDKDADLNTIYGQTSEPFPFRAMSRYPFRPDEAPNSKEYQNYIKTWQNRMYDPSAFQNAGADVMKQHKSSLGSSDNL